LWLVDEQVSEAVVGRDQEVDHVLVDPGRMATGQQFLDDSHDTALEPDDQLVSRYWTALRPRHIERFRRRRHEVNRNRCCRHDGWTAIGPLDVSGPRRLA
jgi:hypothetical protein